MDPRYIEYDSYQEGGLKPPSFPSNNISLWRPIQMSTGEVMKRNHSNESAYSVRTHFSDEIYSASYDTPATEMSYESPVYSNYYPSQSAESTPTLQSSHSYHGSSTHPTPTSLGWLPDTKLWEFYKFVIPKGKEPYFELLPDCFLTRDTPQRVYLDCPRHLKKNEFPCLYPGVCDEKIFKRPADLERHYRNVHGGPDQKEVFCCDYAPCRKVRGPFTRKDHFRDHLRDYHKEDLGSMKREKKGDKKKMEEKNWLKLQDEWVAGRKIVADWWRCPKCLHRVQIADFGYECHDCKCSCDRERANRIEAVRARAITLASTVSTSNEMEGVQYRYAPAASAATTYPADCVACGDTGWISNARGDGWDACQTCQSPVEQYYKDDEDMYASGGSYATSRY